MCGTGDWAGATYALRLSLREGAKTKVVSTVVLAKRRRTGTGKEHEEKNKTQNVSKSKAQTRTYVFGRLCRMRNFVGTCFQVFN